MATLLHCIECGGIISSQACECPRCQTPYPFGVKCAVCCQVVKRSEAIKTVKDYGETSQPSIVRYFHSACYKQVSQVRVGRSRTSCPTCRHPIEFETSSSITCPNCGHQISTKLENPSFANCCYCGFPVNTRLEVAVKEVQRRFLDGLVLETVYAHKVCYTKEREVKERGIRAQNQSDTKLSRKINTNNLRKKQTKKYQETLALSLVLGLLLGLIVGGLGGVISHFAFGFGLTWQSAALLGFGGVFLLTVGAIWIISLFE